MNTPLSPRDPFNTNLHSKRQFGRKAGQARRYGKVRLRLVPLNASWYKLYRM
jgi:hypothetical protein